MDFVDDRETLFERVAKLRRFSENANRFWKEYLAVATELVHAERATLVIRSDSAGEWRRIAATGEGKSGGRTGAKFNRKLVDLATETSVQGVVIKELEAGPLPDHADVSISLRLAIGDASDQVVLLALLSNISKDAARASLESLKLISDVPEAYLLNQSVGKAQGEVRKFAVVVDLIAEIDEHRRFQSAIMAACNGMADRFGCDRVTLGWMKGGYIHLLAMSLTDRLDRKTEAARAIEVAMEECTDQDEDIVLPIPQESNFVALSHTELARKQGTPNLCTLPIRDDGKPVGAIMCERAEGTFGEVEVQQLRLATDLMSRRLSDLRKHDRWFGARWAGSFRDGCAKLVGSENTWPKVFGLIGAIVLAVLVFVKVDYRVEAKCIVRSDEVAFVATPFDGYLDTVNVKAGDKVKQGDSLVQLNTEDLLLQRSSATADISRHQREMEKARASRSLAEMRISEALIKQSESQLQLVEHRLKQSEIHSSFDGIVVEGDLRQRIGAPVKQGEALFRLARLDSLYLEADLSERDFHEIAENGTGEVAFLSRPDLVFPVQVTQIESAAIPRDDGNVFLVRGDFEGDVQDWWRPGMSGLCKLHVGERRLIWIFTHRTIDFLRMWLWW